MSKDPNSFDKEIKDAQEANPGQPNQGTDGDKTPPANTPPEGDQGVDYKTKFAASTTENQRILKENEDLKVELAKANGATPPARVDGKTMENLYPGFENLDPEAQANLIAYTDVVTQRATDNIMKNPAIKFSQDQYNTSKWNEAFGKVAEKYPDLKNDPTFRDKYFKVEVVPDNIGTVLEDLAKIHLFDKAKDLGATEEKDRAGRVDLERNTGGDKTPTTSRTLADWNRMAQENPAEFARNAKEFNADMASGRLSA